MTENHPTGPITIAVWSPGWHKLDQSLELGQTERFWFFSNPETSKHEEIQLGHSHDHESAEQNGNKISAGATLYFFNQLRAEKGTSQVRSAKVVGIGHKELGQLRQIDTNGMDYIFVAMDGTEYVVNAEEEPGQLYDDETNISDWKFEVLLADVSDPLKELV